MLFHAPSIYFLAREEADSGNISVALELIEESIKIDKYPFFNKIIIK